MDNTEYTVTSQAIAAMEIRIAQALEHSGGMNKAEREEINQAEQDLRDLANLAQTMAKQIHEATQGLQLAIKQTLAIEQHRAYIAKQIELLDEQKNEIGFTTKRVSAQTAAGVLNNIAEHLNETVPQTQFVKPK